MGEMRWVVAPEIKTPEKIEIPSFVAEGVRAGLAELEALVRKDQPEALVIILRKAALLEGAVRKRLPEIPMVEAAMGRKFMARYKNQKMASGYAFEVDATNYEPVIDPNDYSVWLRQDREAIAAAEKLRADLRGKGIVNPREIVGVDDSSYSYGEFTRKMTWPTMVKMAFGKETRTAWVNVCKGEKFDWLTQIIKLNFGEENKFNQMFLDEVATGRFYGSGRPVQNEADLRAVGIFLREVHPQYRFPAEGEIVITSQIVDYLVTLHQRVKDALTVLF